MKKTKFQEQAKRRYFLHRAVKKTFTVLARERSVLVEQSSVDVATSNPYLRELLSEFGYNIQLTL